MVEHKDTNRDTNDGKGGHPVLGWSDVATEVLRLALVQEPGDLGITIRQTGGSTAGVYFALGVTGQWLRLDNTEAEDEPRIITASGAMVATDTVLLVESGGGVITIDLVAAALFEDKILRVIHTVPTNNLTMDPDGSESIQGVPTLSLAGDGIIRSLTLFCDGTAWFIA